MKNTFKLTVLPKNEDEFKKVTAYLTKAGFLFTSSIGGKNAAGKSDDEIRLDAEYKSLTTDKNPLRPEGLRFRLTNEMKAEIAESAGTKNRIYFLKLAIKALKKGAVKAE